MFNIRIRLEEGDEEGSKVGVFVCQLEGEGGEYVVEVATVLEVARTKKGRSKSPFGEEPLRDRLGDCRLPCPSKSVKPEHGRLVGVVGPRLDLI